MAVAAAAAPAAGGLHTLRNVQLSILGQLAEHRTSLQELVVESAQKSEDFAVQRAQDLLSPPLTALQKRVDEELPSIRKTAEVSISDCRTNIQNLRCEISVHKAEVRSDLIMIREEMSVLITGVKANANEVARLQGVHDEVRSAQDGIRSGIVEMAKDFQERIEASSGRAAQIAEEKWGRALNEKIGCLESILHDVDTRSRRDTSHAMDTSKMIEKYLLQIVDKLRADMSLETQRQVTDSMADVQEEIQKLSEQTKQRILENQMFMDSRVALTQQQLKANIIASASETLTTADKNTEAKINKISSHVNESVETIHSQLHSQTQNLVESEAKLRAELQTSNRNSHAATHLTQDAIGDLRRRVEGLMDGASDLRVDLEKVDKVSTDAILALRSALRMDDSRLQKIEDVDFPQVYALLEEKTSESHTRSLKAAMDYAERLQRLPPSFGDEPWTPPTTAGERQAGDFDLGATGSTSASFRGALNSTGPSSLPPLSPRFERKERA